VCPTRAVPPSPLAADIRGNRGTCQTLHCCTKTHFAPEGKEPGLGICAPRALEVRSRFSFCFYNHSSNSDRGTTVEAPKWTRVRPRHNPLSLALLGTAQHKQQPCLRRGVALHTTAVGNVCFFDHDFEMFEFPANSSEFLRISAGSGRCTIVALQPKSPPSSQRTGGLPRQILEGLVTHW
jgi:hypothetical protein